MAQQDVERRQGSQSLPGKSGTEAQSERRKQQQGGEQQAARQTRGLQKRSPTLPIGPFGGLSPFSLMRRMLEDMDRMFEGLGGARGGIEGSTAAGFAPIDVIEREGRFVVRADVPGLSPDDIRLEVRDGALLLEGERRQEVEVEGEEGIYRSERMYGRFSRVIPLPEAADVDKAAARFENGVLEIEIPMRQDAQRRRIDIQGASKPQDGTKQQGSADSAVH